MARCEAGVFFLMGRIYKKLNQPVRARHTHNRTRSAFSAQLPLPQGSAQVTSLPMGLISLFRCVRHGLQGAAMVNFTNAIDLKPSSAEVSQIKAAMESLSTADGADSDEEEAWGGGGRFDLI